MGEKGKKGGEKERAGERKRERRHGEREREGGREKADRQTGREAEIETDTEMTRTAHAVILPILQSFTRRRKRPIQNK